LYRLDLVKRGCERIL